MSTTLIHDVTLVRMTGAASYDQVEHAAVVTEGDRIAWWGKQDDIPDDISIDQRIDGEGGMLTPGLVDCHTHLVYAGNRAEEFEQRLQGVSYADIAKAGGGIMSTVNATRTASVEALIDQSAIRLQTLIDHGVTTVEIKSGYGLERDTELRMLEAATRLGDQLKIRVCRTLLAAHALPPEYQGRSDDYIDLVCNDILPSAAEARLVDAVDAFCEHIGFSADQVERVFTAAKTFDLPIKCHAEQLSDSGGALMSAKHGALSADHLEYLQPADVSAMAASGTVAVLLPGAFYVLRETQLPPMKALRDHQLPIALGTDANPGSSPVFSPLITMNMACTLFAMTPLEALAGFTIQGAKALGLDQEIGSIEVGKRADLALWRCDHPAELSYHIGLNSCIGTLRGGHWHPRSC